MYDVLRYICRHMARDRSRSCSQPVCYERLPWTCARASRWWLVSLWPRLVVKRSNHQASIASSSVTWRWIYWVMMMFAGACTAVAAIFLPETNASVLLLKKASCITLGTSRLKLINQNHRLSVLERRTPKTMPTCLPVMKWKIGH